MPLPSSNRSAASDTHTLRGNTVHFQNLPALACRCHTKRFRNRAGRPRPVLSPSAAAARLVVIHSTQGARLRHKTTRRRRTSRATMLVMVTRPMPGINNTVYTNTRMTSGKTGNLAWCCNERLGMDHLQYARPRIWIHVNAKRQIKGMPNPQQRLVQLWLGL